MQHWICVTCGTQFAASEEKPDSGPICLDQRQYVGHQGQQWTTLEEMRGSGGYSNTIKQHEPGAGGHRDHAEIRHRAARSAGAQRAGEYAVGLHHLPGR
ncbi:hypothetical protein KDAU_54610 [Dictyobacter aurantiacus]|uniref:Uncharacterized protein n=1 Tax=Dictyobacter aurantiacus TaxID=1936993 RepID=A0A401ZMQ4_9CHLR|nr:hypothetical protein KDAU_54610 [Dictyobacter aurantiacus]